MEMVLPTETTHWSQGTGLTESLTWKGQIPEDKRENLTETQLDWTWLGPVWKKQQEIPEGKDKSYALTALILG